MKRFIPYVLFLIGVILVTGAIYYAWHTSQPQVAATAGGDVPATISGFSLSQKLTGDAAVAGIQQLHLGNVPVASGIVAEYSQKSAVLWVAGTASDANAAAMVANMESSIAEGSSPFKPLGVFQFSGRDVYMLDDGSSQSNFYFQSGSKLIWLAVDYSAAEQALKELLAFYP